MHTMEIQQLLTQKAISTVTKVKLTVNYLTIQIKATLQSIIA